MTVKVLNASGVAHYLALLLVLVGAGIVGSAAVVMSHAQTPPDERAPHIWCSYQTISPNPPLKYHDFTTVVTLHNSGRATAYGVYAQTSALYRSGPDLFVKAQAGTLNPGDSKKVTNKMYIPHSQKGYSLIIVEATAHMQGDGGIKGANIGGTCTKDWGF